MNFYEILNVKTDANDKEIKKAYRVLAKKYHPDTYEGNKELAETKMQQINVAYDTLSNPNLRSKYDRDNGINQKEETINNVREDFKNTRDYRTKKNGVNYNVRYTSNRNNVKYNRYGYAEANYYHENRNEKKEKYKNKPFSTLFKGEQLKYTVFYGTLAIVAVAVLLSMAFKSVKRIVDSTVAISNQINATSSSDTYKYEKEDNDIVPDYNESTEKISNYLNGIKDTLNVKKEEFIKKSSEKDKEKALKSLGITNEEDQKAVLEFINGL